MKVHSVRIKRVSRYRHFAVLLSLILILYALSFGILVRRVYSTDIEITLTLTEDCAVRSPTPDTNFGANQDVESVNTTTGNKERFSYFKFNLSEIPASALIVSSTFYLYAQTVGASGYANQNAKPVENQTWIESDITWNQRPPVNDTILDTDGTNATGVYWDWNLTDYVAEKYGDADANISLVIVNNHVSYASWTGVWYRSKEYAGALDPFLNVTYSIILPDSESPKYLYPFGLNSTLNGSICQFTVNFSDNIGLSHGLLSWNNSGSWSNVSYVLAGTIDLALWNQTLNSTEGVRVEYLFFVNDTTDNWNSTVQHFIYTNTKPIVLVVGLTPAQLFVGLMFVACCVGGILLLSRRTRTR